MLAADSPPNEVYNESERLGEQFNPNHADVPQESSVALFVVLINIDTRETMCHFTTFMVSHNFQVMSLVARFHDFKERLWVSERVPHVRHQFLIVVSCEVQELLWLNLEGLQLELDLLLLLFLCSRHQSGNIRVITCVFRNFNNLFALI